MQSQLLFLQLLEISRALRPLTTLPLIQIIKCLVDGDIMWLRAARLGPSPKHYSLIVDERAERFQKCLSHVIDAWLIVIATIARISLRISCFLHDTRAR